MYTGVVFAKKTNYMQADQASHNCITPNSNFVLFCMDKPRRLYFVKYFRSFDPLLRDAEG